MLRRIFGVVVDALRMVEKFMVFLLAIVYSANFRLRAFSRTLSPFQAGEAEHGFLGSFGAMIRTHFVELFAIGDQVLAVVNRT